MDNFGHSLWVTTRAWSFKMFETDKCLATISHM